MSAAFTENKSVQLLGFSFYRSLTLCSRPSMRFLFVRPELCLRLPSDFTSRWTPLPSAVTFPLPGGLGTFTR